MLSRNQNTAIHRLKLDFCRLLSLAALFLVFGNAAKSEIAETSPSADDIEVFRSLLQKNCHGSDGKFVIVSDGPPSSVHSDFPKKWQISASTKNHFLERGKENFRWPSVEICAAVRIADGSHVDELVNAGSRIPSDWKAFYEEFPRATGLARVSLPAFTPDGKHAIVYKETICGPLCGNGFYFEMEKKGNVWKVLRRATAWIS